MILQHYLVRGAIRFVSSKTKESSNSNEDDKESNAENYDDDQDRLEGAGRGSRNNFKPSF
jgi:hypothetical protein